MQIKSSKLTATPSSSGWVQAHEFVPEDPEKLEKRGKIFAIIATKVFKEGIEAVSLGREIITRLHEEYFAKLEKDSLPTLVEAVKKIKEEFVQLNPQVGVIVYLNEQLLVVGCGGVVAQVIRDNSMVILLDSKDDVISVSGKPIVGDIFVLGTKAFFSDFSYDEIKQSLLNKGVESSVEEFAPKIHASPNLGSAGFLALEFGGEEKINIDRIQTQEEAVPNKSQEDLDIKVDNKPDGVPEGKKPSAINNFLQRLPKRSIKLRRQNLEQATPQGKKTTLAAGIVLLSLLIVSVVFGLNQKKTKDLQKTYGTKLESAISDYDESLNVFSIDVSKSRELFLSAKEKLNEVKNSDLKDDRIQKLENDISEKQGEILGEFDAQISEFLDLTLQTADFNGNKMVSSGDEVFVLDKDKKQIISFDVSSKNTKIAAGSDDVEDAKDVGSYEDRVFVSRDDGIYEITDGEEKITDETFDYFYLYSANLYTLSKNDNMIYRYPGTQSSFGEKKDWLAPGIEADFSKVVDMTIDGSIWLLSSSGKVSRFTLGSPQLISLEGLPEAMVNPTAIYTNENLVNVYILDANKGRIVVLEKGGKFKVQYVAEEIKQAKDLVVSEEEGRILLLNGSKILSIELKN